MITYDLSEVRIRMNKFMAIKIFVRVAEEGGFTAAAAKLGISVSAVTKAVSRLEDDLGAQLFTRTTRQIRITDYAQEFYERCVGILADLEDAESELLQGTGAARGRVRLVLPFSFGRVTVLPELPRFYERHPQITLEIDFSDDGVDMIAKGYDVAVRTGTITDSRLNMRVLKRSEQVTVASSEYLRLHGTPQVPDDLRDHDCIVGRFGREWTFLDDERRPRVTQVSGRVIINSGDALREAAVAGLGLAQGTWWLFRKDLEAGRVVPVLQAYAAPGMPISILYSANRHTPRKVRAFIDFLIEISK
ncbi:LysR family transcriptional regulator [Roseicitreum antarcticum]|uniref:LysR family transcriptional regulator n=1 Tax=Roseicitreum antarcticum TaxID=564137 RepID=UPI001C40A662|nr:LysR family transcriptional regulator [Roseicitreum antarcticum]